MHSLETIKHINKSKEEVEVVHLTPPYRPVVLNEDSKIDSAMDDDKELGDREPDYG